MEKRRAFGYTPDGGYVLGSSISKLWRQFREVNNNAFIHKASSECPRFIVFRIVKRNTEAD